MFHELKTNSMNEDIENYIIEMTFVIKTKRKKS